MGWCVQNTSLALATYRSLPSATLNASNVGLANTLLGSAFQATIVWGGGEEHFK